MWVVTKSFDTKRYKFVQGLPLFSKLNTPSGRKWMKSTYGNDVIKEVDYSNLDDFYELIGASSESDLKGKFVKLKAISDEQAKTIRELRKENDQLKKKLKLEGAGDRNHEN